MVKIIIIIAGALMILYEIGDVLVDVFENIPIKFYKSFPIVSETICCIGVTSFFLCNKNDAELRLLAVSCAAFWLIQFIRDATAYKEAKDMLKEGEKGEEEDEDG